MAIESDVKLKAAVASLAERPEAIIRLTNTEMFSIPLEDRQEMQLRAARARFEACVESIPLVRRLAGEQSVTRIGTLEDLGLLLVPHSASKSYPLSFVENARLLRIEW